METDEWNARIVGPLNEWLESGAVDGGIEQTLGYLVELGNSAEPADRDGVVNSIKALCKGKAGSPFGRRGKPPALPPAALAVSDEVGAIVANAMEEAFNSNSAIQAVILRHGRSKGSRHYADGAAFGKSMAKTAQGVIKAAHKDGGWDGSLDGLLSTIDLSDEEE